MNNLKGLFKNQELLKHALTHKSWVNEHKNERGSNERLEFLGDAVLEFIVSCEIYKKFPDKNEGYLTSLRANLVNTQNLAALALRLNVGEALYLSKGEEEGGGRENPSLLADTLEAIIGALFLDQDISKVYEFINENLISEIPIKVAKPLKDAKSRLQELAQSKGLSAPKYKVLEERGPDHNKQFVVEVFIKGKKEGHGIGKSKSASEQIAAEEALKSSNSI
ncbi:ribonuclease III [Candidatus Woesebacteria bacterium RIFOXYD1_FULL_40_21]|uniref:Ribonuclease 3 n=1 Tax=Candidatus Woesebacteria bacterium RIFOXYD1_FULL_40_21 TaxID=1802549 RepID=A0A1F8DFP6_9BACT|nr:MAG: ribonuclease III [Candidatus Woesebacteria bacterium RIFOXYD1_FULL_40_21]